MTMIRNLLACMGVLLAAGCATTPSSAPSFAPSSSSAPQASEPRVAVMSAFAPELALLQAKVAGARRQTFNGVEFTTGTLEGKPVVLFLSGISMVNASMNTQLALDRFHVTHIVFTGIAGGVDPNLRIGDVVVADQWSEYLEALFAREVAPGRFVPPSHQTDVKLPNFGMIHPRPVEVRSTGHADAEKKVWFDVDPQLIAVARRAVAAVKLERCDAERQCLEHQPSVVVGGHGVSGQAFVDNAAFREYTFRTFHASVLDMESAAVAHVAYSNGVPFIAFRSLSDLAGGGEGENQIKTFFRVAADNSARVLLAFLAAWK
ncbi:MAG TPA: 5'-methylthioadenosine/S-adenosylhomocysteine nucleosidase [Ramlibacter sp.]|uniref:5'-methylthioadenosine/S-adenosylhomocysteine nucleosidase n=1 Tax=Ramlibacter sp. TaxID=1917967 RepID=UPI002C5A9420|nr:5'-methylthioadenosine/S-adenosylhomocysteine nucleosidase [Ramlibacter sp.]HVZ42741.1 5'-methylthioadenosine/S-adenosylhomocysteine nucleosidase [Ramlibacter sp.]